MSSAEVSSSKVALRVVWLENKLGLAIDQVLSKGSSPITIYYFWPQEDAWEQLKTEMESRRSWIPEYDCNILLNRATDLINYWQEEGKGRPMAEAKIKFPDVIFTASS